MLDEGKIRQLEGQLQRRVQEAGENYRNMMAAQRKSELTLEEIEKLKADMERERRETMAEMQMYNRKIRDMEG